MWVWGFARSGPPEPHNGGQHEPTLDPRRTPQSTHQCRGALATVPVLHLGPLFSFVCSLLIFVPHLSLRRFLLLCTCSRFLLFFFVRFFLLSLVCLACVLDLLLSFLLALLGALFLGRPNARMPTTASLFVSVTIGTSQRLVTTECALRVFLLLHWRLGCANPRSSCAHKVLQNLISMSASPGISMG